MDRQRVPASFCYDDDGYLQVLLDPDRNAGEVAYLKVRQALERVADADSSCIASCEIWTALIYFEPSYA